MNSRRIAIILAVIVIILGIVCVSSVTMFLVRSNAATPSQAIVTADRCILQESKPVLLVLLTGQGAQATCAKITSKSRGRYFDYYNVISVPYIVMCSVPLNGVLYTVYDVVPAGAEPSTRYSFSKVCALLQSGHRLIGQGF